MRIPQKPFPSFKWRWAVLTPTESLNNPSVFLGVLRTYAKYEGLHPGDEKVLQELKKVQDETGCTVDLVRTSDRNLIRNSGQYWKALGVLDEAHGKIAVTPFGHMLAEAEITKVEFSATVIKSFELPNRIIISDTSEWDKIGLRIKPLQLILDIIKKIHETHGKENAYITVEELIEVIIPLSGSFAKMDEYLEALLLYRHRKLDVSTWPNCAPEANDRRMAREFLLFLQNYGYMNAVKEPGASKEKAKYYLSNISIDEIEELDRTDIDSKDPVAAVKKIQITQIPANIERKKVSRELLQRPYQSKFRSNILLAYNNRCLLTGVDIDNVLEAAHIIPISNKGSDQLDNGICLRSDIHQLFDSGHLRIFPDGSLQLSNTAKLPHNYSYLPNRIIIPDFVNRDHLSWRINYY